MFLPDDMLLDTMILEGLEWDDHFKECMFGEDCSLSPERANVLAQIFRETPTAFIMIDNDGKVTMINRAASQMFGVEHERGAELTWERLREQRILRDSSDREIGPDDDPYAHAIRYQRRTTSHITIVDREYGTEDWAAVTSYPLFADSQRKERVGAMIEICDLSEYKGMQDMLYHQATHDLLTGMANRASLSGSISKALARSKRSGTSGALLFIDVDHFKNINNEFGHSSSDSLLWKIADRMVKVVRDTDVIARVGGDEFAILLADIPDKDVRSVTAEISERICRSVAEPYTVRRDTAHITVSIGSSIFPSDAADEEQLFMKADEAMNRVKVAGRNGWAFWSGEETHHL